MENNEEDTSNVAIVRSIASYLSLSEVESIGSLYSMASPQPYAASSSATTMQRTPIIRHQHQHQHHYTNCIREEDDALMHEYEKDVVNSNLNTGLSSSNSSGNSSCNSSCNSSSKNSSRGNGHGNGNGNGNGGNASTVSSVEQDGPDAAAGFGSADSFPKFTTNTTTATATATATTIASPTKNNRYHENGENLANGNAIMHSSSECTTDHILDNVDMDMDMDIDPSSSSSSSSPYTPGLIALTPISLDDDEYEDEDEDDDNYSYYKHQQHSNDLSSSSSLTTTRYKSNHEHLKEIQNKLQKEIMSHPKSIRSYCLSSHQKAIEMKQKQKQEQYRRRRNHRHRHGQQQQQQYDYYNLVESPSLSYNHHNHNQQQQIEPPIHIRLLQILTSPVFSNIPLSILFDLSIQTIQITNDTFLASVKLSTVSIQSILSTLSKIIHSIYTSISQTISHVMSATTSTPLNPFVIFDFLVSIQQKAGGMIVSSEAIVTGIQSVATLGSLSMSGAGGGGVGGAGGDNKSHHFSHGGTFMDGAGGIAGDGGAGGVVGGGAGGGRLTRDGGLGSVMSSSGKSGGLRSNMSDWWRGGVGGRSNNNENGNLICEKMFRRLKKVDSAAKVIKYIERDDEVLTHHAKKRVQKMMHYRVPLRPFVATIEIQQQKKQQERQDEKKKMNSSSESGRRRKFRNIDFALGSGGGDGSSARMENDFGDFGDGENMLQSNVNMEVGRALDEASSFVSSSNDSNFSVDEDTESPFMCTPKSFPPTPSSRAHVMARGTKFAQDVVFLARDQLRVQEGLDSKNEQTRAMAKALLDGKRLAVFNASDVGSGIHLSCGQHCASKVGNDLYCSAKGMIPVLRNSFVYFEMSVSTPPLLSMMLHHASLSIGLSTLEMPSNALVGAWKGSVGLCSTGQILAGSQWCSPLEPKTYGSGSTVGCLVYLDDGSAFETWDGVMVTASIVFNVDGHVIIPAGVMGQGGHNVNQAISNGMDDLNQSSLVPMENNEPNAVLPLFVPREEELYPTLTLHSTQTEVLCRFCASDIFATSRTAIGAPYGVTVYAVDGSVLFDTDDGYNIDGDSTNLAELTNSSMHSLSDVETPRLENQDSYIYNSVA